MQASLDILVKKEAWEDAATAANNLSELQLTFGDVGQSVGSGACSRYYADQSGKLFQRMARATTYANALHQAGNIAVALALFQEAEKLQRKWQPEFPNMYSLFGFQYCDLLLAQGNIVEVLDRAKEMLDGSAQDGLLPVALYQLTLGRAHLQRFLTPHPSPLPQGEREQDQEQAAHWLEQTVAGLRAAGYQQMLPLGLLARAALYRHTRDFDKALKDLQEVCEIADGSGMRLHLTDYHLEMARLLVAEELGDECIYHHLTAAERLINETGYHRRDKELAELKQQSA